MDFFSKQGIFSSQKQKTLAAICGAALLVLVALVLSGNLSILKLGINNPASLTASTANYIVATTSATWTAPAGVTQVVVTIVGGGGGGGQGQGPSNGGCDCHTGNPGGAGQVVNQTVTVVPGQSYSIVVGAGGTGYPSVAGQFCYIGNGYASSETGANSSFNGVVANGGIGGSGDGGTTYPGAGGTAPNSYPGLTNGTGYGTGGASASCNGAGANGQSGAVLIYIPDIFMTATTPASGGTSVISFSASNVTASSCKLTDPLGATVWSDNTPSYTFNYTGADQTWAPTGSGNAIVKMWGAGGGGFYNTAGGGGGYTEAVLPYTAQNYKIIVGQGGVIGSSSPTYGGGAPGNSTASTGGGRSAIRDANAVEKITAGGGGGSQYNANPGDGGGGPAGTGVGGGPAYNATTQGGGGGYVSGGAFAGGTGFCGGLTQCTTTTGGSKIVSGYPVGTTTPNMSSGDYVRTIGIGGYGYPDIYPAISGSRPYALATADFNSDGYPDLATQYWFSSNVSVYLNNGNGRFATKVDYATAQASGRNTSLGVADFNGDSKPDIMVSDDGAGVVTLFLNQGNGTFVKKGDYATAAWPYGIATADFNSDGKMDAAVVTSDGSGITILTGDGAGNFPTRVDYLSSGGTPSPQGITVGDFNNDGKPDVAVANTGTNNIGVFRNTSTTGGTISMAAVQVFVVGTGPQAIAAGDLNGDGKNDIVVGNTNALAGANNGGTISVLINSITSSSTLAFAAQATYAVSGGPYTLALADLNRDGKLDVISPQWSANKVSILYNKGNGTYFAQSPVSTGVSPAGIVVTDFDKDGFLDYAFTDSDPNGTGGSNSNIGVSLGAGMGGNGLVKIFPILNLATTTYTTVPLSAPSTYTMTCYSSQQGASVSQSITITPGSAAATAITATNSSGVPTSGSVSLATDQTTNVAWSSTGAVDTASCVVKKFPDPNSGATTTISSSNFATGNAANGTMVDGPFPSGYRSYSLWCNDTNNNAITPPYVRINVVDMCNDIAGAQVSAPTGCTTPGSQPGACIPSGYTYNSGTNSCVASTVTLNTFTAVASKVRKNIPTNVTFSWTGTNLPASCTVTGTGVNVSGASPRVASVNISAPTIYTLTCGATTKTVTVGLLPTFQEI